MILELMDNCLSIGISTADDPGMVEFGRLPGIDPGMGCLCLFCRWSREDRDPGTGLMDITELEFPADVQNMRAVCT